MSFTVVPIRLVLVLLLLVMAWALATVSDLSRYIIFSIITDRVDVIHRRAYPSGAGIAPVGDGLGPGYRVTRLPISRREEETSIWMEEVSEHTNFL